jgi:hypothetical protein
MAERIVETIAPVAAIDEHRCAAGDVVRAQILVEVAPAGDEQRVTGARHRDVATRRKAAVVTAGVAQIDAVDDDLGVAVVRDATVGDRDGGRAGERRHARALPQRRGIDDADRVGRVADHEVVATR